MRTIKKKVLYLLIVVVVVLLLGFGKSLDNTLLSSTTFNTDTNNDDKLSSPLETSEDEPAYMGFDNETNERMWKDHEKAKTYFGTKDWRRFYPEVAKYLDLIEQGVTSWPVPLMNTTSAKFTTVQVQQATNGMFKIGDIMHAVIQSKNGHSVDKVHGGDYFYVRLVGVDKEGKFSGNAISPEVVDCGDGIYNITAPLLWAGNARLLVGLVHPSEAVAMLVNKTTGYVGPGITFFGTYTNGEKRECNVGLRTIDPLKPPCNFSHPEKGVTWYCYPPTSGGCPSLKWLAIKEFPSQGIKLGKQPLFTAGINWQSGIEGSGATFPVAETNFTNQMLENLPKCNVLSGVNELAHDKRLGKVPGLYMDNRWRSLQCKNEDGEDLKRAASCFRDKVLYFIGDSTLRQWYLVLSKVLPLKENDSGDETVWQRPRFGNNAALNITVNYIGHGSPLHGLGPPASRPYVVDTLDGIKHGSGEGVYIVINLALHFYLVDTEVYIKRIKAIRRSVEKLLERSPDVTVLVRGCLRHKISKIPVPSEWFSFRLCKILRATFEQVPGVGFVDTWSMTSAKLLEDTHPDDRTVAQHVALFTSYVCPVK